MLFTLLDNYESDFIFLTSLYTYTPMYIYHLYLKIYILVYTNILSMPVIRLFNFL